MKRTWRRDVHTRIMADTVDRQKVTTLASRWYNFFHGNKFIELFYILSYLFQMISLQGIIVLAIVVWYSLVIMRSTNNYYKEAYKKHLEQEYQNNQKGLSREISLTKEKQVQAVVRRQELYRDEENCYEDDDIDVCSSNSEEAFMYDKMYKKYKNYP